MFPEVLTALIGRVPRHQPATVHGFKRFALRGQVFPAMVPGPADSKVGARAPARVCAQGAVPTSAPSLEGQTWQAF